MDAKMETGHSFAGNASGNRLDVERSEWQCKPGEIPSPGRAGNERCETARLYGWLVILDQSRSCVAA
jgi:hypothetical protein